MDSEAEGVLEPVEGKAESGEEGGEKARNLSNDKIQQVLFQLPYVLSPLLGCGLSPLGV